ncbi:MAG TPA: bifunctional oligoribonuclease/PAP phosphatase NrnA [Bacteroidia bacterium]|nr:bifunctional oligoribonuclease/PAP phosphatase NrnA [Bacteroidia bacterium]
MKAKPTSSLRKFLSIPRKLVIVTHWSPDGDAIGSSLGLGNFLKNAGHAVKVIVPNDYPSFLYWMRGHSQVINADAEPAKASRFLSKAELIFCLDFNDLKRLNELGDVIAALDIPKVMIDHHPEPTAFAAYAKHVVKVSSTAELVYEFIRELKGEKRIDRHIADCLYTGIMTDTGGFRFPATSGRTHRIVANLIDAGAKNADVYSRVYEDNSENRLRLLGYALQEKLVVLPEFRTAYFTLNQSEHARFNYRKGDTEGLVNYALTIRGIVFAAFISEREGQVKCSFRSKGKFDVNEFARAHFKGGGHRNAAGGQSDGSIENVVKKFKDLLPQYKDKLNKV